MTGTIPGTSWRVEDGIVRENRLVGSGLGDIGRMVVEAPAVARAARPGHFVMVRTWDGEPLLPRAMAPLAYDAASGRMEIFYKVKGPGTRAMAGTLPGAAAHVTGPLGRPVIEGFYGRNVALIGRGVGITPLLPLAKHIVATGGSVSAYLSARTRAYLFGLDEFASLGPVHTQVDDEAAEDELATNALATDALREHCRGGGVDAAYVCGSWRLARAVEDIGASEGFPGFVFLESKMGCGVGYCKGCPVGLRGGGGYRLVCVEGPVFPTREIQLTGPVHPLSEEPGVT